MPAAHYIVSLQIALVAASAAYLKSDRSTPGLVLDPVRNARPVGLHPAYVEDESVDDESGLVMVSAPLRALAEAAPTEPQARAMGFRPGSVSRPRLPVETDGQPEAEPVTPAPKALPLEAGHLPAGAQLSAIAPEEIKFDPVPDGQGYSITADSATNFDLTTKTVVFAGNVSLHCADFVLTSDRLVVYMESEGSAMKRMLANGDVDVKLLQGAASERYHGSGEEADFDPAARKIVMRGWPRIIGHGREHRAASATTKMTLFTKPAKLETEGRAQTRILAGENGALPSFTSN